MEATIPQQRHWSRRLVLQALYQWQLADHSIDELLSQYLEDENWDKVDTEYFVELLSESIKQYKKLIQEISNYTETPTEQIDPIEKSILLLATYELLHMPETPYKVVISEATNLCKKFGSEAGYTFINAILDKIAQNKINNTSL